MIGIAVLLVATGCSGHAFQDDYVAPLSSGNCVAGWNAGNVAWLPNRQEVEPTTQVGLIARRVWVSDGDTQCTISFDLGDGRVQTITEADAVRDSSDAAKGLEWEDGVGGSFGLESYHAFMSRTPGGWNACQDDTGSVQLGDDCTTHAATVRPYDVISRDRQLEQDWISHSGGYPWWLGMTYRGLPPVEAEATPDGSDIFYEVRSGSQHWRMELATAVADNPIGPCARNDTRLCPGGTLAAHVLVNQFRPRPHVIVSVYASLESADGGNTQPGLPGTLKADMIAHLRPVPIPDTHPSVSECVAAWNAYPVPPSDAQAALDRDGRVIVYLNTTEPNTGCRFQFESITGTRFHDGLLLDSPGGGTDMTYGTGEPITAGSTKFELLPKPEAGTTTPEQTALAPFRKPSEPPHHVENPDQSLHSLVSRYGAGTLRFPPRDSTTPPLVVSLLASPHSDFIQAQWRAELLTTAFKRHGGAALQLQIRRGSQSDMVPIDTLEPLSPSLPAAKARQIILGGLARLGWIPKIVSVFDADGTDAFIIAEIPRSGTQLTQDDYSTPWSMGENVIGDANSQYGVCDDCSSAGGRFSAYFLRLVDPRGQMLLEGGVAKYEEGWISASRENPGSP